MSELISSVQNPRVKNLVRLRTGSHRRRQERFLVEGYREISRAIDREWPVETLFFCPELFKAPDAFELVHLAEERNVEVVQMTANAFVKASYRQGADGLLSVCQQASRDLDDMEVSSNPLLVVVEAVEKPGNLGAIFRAADAAGADALILTETVADPYNPNCIRASQGALFSLPFYVTDNLSVIEFLERHGIGIIVTSPASDRLIWDADMTQPSAIVLGAEDTGLSRDWLESFGSFKLPMKGTTDSLNVASMASITLFEAVRQRTIQPSR